MNIIRVSRDDITKKDMYKLTMSSETRNVKDLTDDVEIEVNTFVEYEEENHDGEIVQLLSIMDNDGEVFATQSDTFKREFYKMWELGFSQLVIRKISGTTNAGRPYVSCVMADSTVE